MVREGDEVADTGTVEGVDCPGAISEALASLRKKAGTATLLEVKDSNGASITDVECEVIKDKKTKVRLWGTAVLTSSIGAFAGRTLSREQALALARALGNNSLEDNNGEIYLQVNLSNSGIPDQPPGLTPAKRASMVYRDGVARALGPASQALSGVSEYAKGVVLVVTFTRYVTGPEQYGWEEFRYVLTPEQLSAAAGLTAAASQTLSAARVLRRPRDGSGNFGPLEMVTPDTSVLGDH